MLNALLSAEPRRGDGPRGRRCRALLLACTLLLACGVTLAEGIGVSRAQLDPEGDGWRLDARLHIDLPPAIAEAVEKGVTLEFDLVFVLVRPRAWWFDSTITERREIRRIAFNNLTRSYRVTFGDSSETIERLDDALDALASVRMPRVVASSAVDNGRKYKASLRVGLDWSHLPKALQVNSLASSAWRVKPGELEWDFTP